ncbi:MAG: dihydropteroate synthase [Propionibacteriaceae bacterium]
MTIPGRADLPHLRHPVREIGGRRFDFDHQVAVMAVVNRTPDSFHDRGRTFALDGARQAAVAAAGDGADWVDVGGVPFSPDTPYVSVTEELDRVLPVVAAVSAATDVVISVDTVRAAVAEQAIAAGAAVINDTSGMSDPELPEVVAASDATLVITHSLAAPGAHLRRPTYEDVVDEVRAQLAERVAYAVARGVPEDRIVIDPGHDLNKNTLHTLELTRRFAEIASLGLPALAAVSNKDFIGEMLDRPPGRRLEGSLAAATFCIAQGARIIRMHDVSAAVLTARMTEGILGLRPPAYLRHNVD